MRKLFIYGSGGFAREVAWLAEEAGFEIMGFIDDNPDKIGSLINGIEVFSLEEARFYVSEASLIIAVGSPQTREKLYFKASNVGFSFATLVHPRVEKSKFIEMGEGTVIAAGSILTTNISLGKHVQINLDCTIGHDVVMEDFATLAPGVHVSGWVRIGKRAYIGTGAVIINGKEGEPIVIGDDATVGAGAVVTREVPPGTTVVGVPAKPLQK